MQQNLPNDAKKPREIPSRKLLFHLIARHAVLRYKGIHQRGFLRLFGTVHKAAAVLGGGSFKLIGCAVEGGKALALLYVVAALFMQGDAGGKVQRVALFLSDRKSTRLNSSHSGESRMPSSA